MSLDNKARVQFRKRVPEWQLVERHYIPVVYRVLPSRAAYEREQKLDCADGEHFGNEFLGGVFFPTHVRSRR